MFARGGTLTTVDPTGSLDTTVVGITPAGVVARSYTDASSVQHGFVCCAFLLENLCRTLQEIANGQSDFRGVGFKREVPGVEETHRSLR